MKESIEEKAIILRMLIREAIGRGGDPEIEKMGATVGATIMLDGHEWDVRLYRHSTIRCNHESEIRKQLG